MCFLGFVGLGDSLVRVWVGRWRSVPAVESRCGMPEEEFAKREVARAEKREGALQDSVACRPRVQMNSGGHPGDLFSKQDVRS